MNLVLEKGHSRVPVYYEERTNIIGLILVISLPTLSCIIDKDLSLPLKYIWNEFTLDLYCFNNIFQGI